MSLDAAALEALRLALASALAVDDGGDPAIAAEIARVQGHIAAGVGAAAKNLPEPTRHPLTAHLAPAIDAAALRFPALAAALLPVAAELPWRYGYAARAELPGLETRMGWAEIVGPAAPFRSDDVCLGLTFLAPETLYPDHRHPAAELYRIVAGRPTWTVEGATRRRAAPGDPAPGRRAPRDGKRRRGPARGLFVDRRHCVALGLERGGGRMRPKSMDLIDMPGGKGPLSGQAA
jgi:hypothetical protein